MNEVNGGGTVHLSYGGAVMFLGYRKRRRPAVSIHNSLLLCMHCDQVPQAPAAVASLDYEPEQAFPLLGLFVFGPSSKRVDEPTHQLLCIQKRKVTNGGMSLQQ